MNIEGLIPENIREDIVIGGVTGSFKGKDLYLIASCANNAVSLRYDAGMCTAEISEEKVTCTGLPTDRPVWMSFFTGSICQMVVSVTGSTLDKVAVPRDMQIQRSYELSDGKLIFRSSYGVSTVIVFA